MIRHHLKKYKEKLPSIYRLIPDIQQLFQHPSLHQLQRIGKRVRHLVLYPIKTKKRLWVVFFGILYMAFVIAFSLAIKDLQTALSKKTQADAAYTKTQEEIVFWQGKLKEYPNYRDGHFRLAQLYYQVGEQEKAMTAIEQALEIDPNFEKGRELQKILK